MTCERIQSELEQGAILLDVRSENEHMAARLPGSTLMPLNQLARATEMFEPGSRILAYCRSGARSAFAADALKQMGFDAENIGGIIHYPQCIQY